MSFGIIRLISISISIFILFFGIISQINLLSVLNQQNRILDRDNAKLDTQKDLLVQENLMDLNKEIDAQVSQEKIKPISISEKIKPEEIKTQIEAQQNQERKPRPNNPGIVTR